MTLKEILAIVVDALDNPKVDGRPANAGLFQIKEYVFFCIFSVIEAAKEFDKNHVEYERKATAMIQKNGLSRS